MKKTSSLIAIAIALVIGLGVTVYAASSPSASCHMGNNIGLGRISGFRGYDIITNALKSKGVTDSEISNALNSGKTLNSLAEEKGITSDQLKQSILKEKFKLIDDAVSKGTLTKEQGDASKARIKENIDNCTTPGSMNGRAGGGNRGKGMHGNGCLYNSGSTK